MTDAPPIVELEEVRLDLGASFRLSVPRLRLECGRRLCLLGPTGAGKTTLLKICAGLQAEWSGRVTYGGHALRGQPLPREIGRTLTLVFQQPLLLDRTVCDNVEYGMRVRGEHRQARDRAHQALRHLHIADVADRHVATLSGGQRQLVAIARALAIRPDLLMLDEPTSHLDPALVAVVEDAIRNHCNQYRTSVIWSTHNLFQARRIADHVALLWNGELVETGPTDRFFDVPADRRTQAFLRGEMIY